MAIIQLCIHLRIKASESRRLFRAESSEGTKSFMDDMCKEEKEEDESARAEDVTDKPWDDETPSSLDEKRPASSSNSSSSTKRLSSSSSLSSHDHKAIGPEDVSLPGASSISSLGSSSIGMLPPTLVLQSI